MSGDGVEVLVPPSTQIDQDGLAGETSGIADNPGNGMGRLKRGNDPLATGQKVDCGDGLLVGGRFVDRQTRISKIGVLGTDPWIIEARRYRVGLLHLPVRVLEKIRPRPVEDAGAS